MKIDRAKIVERMEMFFGVSGNTDLGRVLNESDTTICNWRSGRSKPKVDFICNKLAPLGINLHWLLTGVGDMKATCSSEKTAESAYYEQAGRSFAQTLEYLSAAKSIQSNAEFSEQEEKEVNKKQQREGKDEERNKPISGTFSGDSDSRTAGQPDSRTAGQPDSRTAQDRQIELMLNAKPRKRRGPGPELTADELAQIEEYRLQLQRGQHVHNKG